MSSAYDTQLADERGESIRALMLEPMINNANNNDVFRLIIRHQQYLVEWFETTLGWRLQVDVAAGFARLFKRAQRHDVSRALRRNRGQKQPFDRRRYQLMTLVCAGLVKYSVTTIGVIARALHEEAGLDTTLKRERSALVDALRKLMEWQVISIRNGEIDAFLESEENNAMVYADTHRLHHLLSSATAPSKIPSSFDAKAACDALLDEPRYAGALQEDDITEAERLRYARHTSARRLLDDPVVYFSEEPPLVESYLEQSSARRWLRDRMTEAGFELEERSEGMIAIDPSATATDKRFPSPVGTVGQVALLMIDVLVPFDKKSATRRLASLSTDDQKRFINKLLKQHPRWAKSWREGSEPMRLVKEAVTLLHDFDLVELDGERVIAKPALARYSVPTDVAVKAPSVKALSNQNKSSGKQAPDDQPPPKQTTLL